jgi:hypothetical protein
MEAAEITDCRVQVEKPQNRALARGLELAKSLNSVNAMRISNRLQKTACPYLIYVMHYVSFNLDAMRGSNWF